MTIWRIQTACWIPKATDLPSEYVILIPFPLQQWLHERSSMLDYSTIPVFFILPKASHTTATGVCLYIATLGLALVVTHYDVCTSVLAVCMYTKQNTCTK
jgi:hypothetical protein